MSFIDFSIEQKANIYYIYTCIYQLQYFVRLLKRCGIEKSGNNIHISWDRVCKQLFDPKKIVESSEISQIAQIDEFHRFFDRAKIANRSIKLVLANSLSPWRPVSWRLVWPVIPNTFFQKNAKIKIVFSSVNDRNNVRLSSYLTCT